MEDFKEALCLGSGFSLFLNPSNFHVLYHSMESLCRNNSEDLHNLSPLWHRTNLSKNFVAALIIMAAVLRKAKERESVILNLGVKKDVEFKAPMSKL